MITLFLAILMPCSNHTGATESSQLLILEDSNAILYCDGPLSLGIRCLSAYISLAATVDILVKFNINTTQRPLYLSPIFVQEKNRQVIIPLSSEHHRLSLFWNQLETIIHSLMIASADSVASSIRSALQAIVRSRFGLGDNRRDFVLCSQTERCESVFLINLVLGSSYMPPPITEYISSMFDLISKQLDQIVRYCIFTYPWQLHLPYRELFDWRP